MEYYLHTDRQETINVKEGKRYRSPRTHILIHEGASEIARQTEERFDAGQYYPMRLANLANGTWTGRSFDTYRDVVTGTEQPWEEGLAMVESITEKLRGVDLPVPVVVRRRQVWGESDGDFNLDRCLIGQSCWRTTKSRPIGGPQIIQMAVQIGARADVAWRDMMFRPATCLALATLLEDAGYSTEIIAFSHADQAFASNDRLLQGVWVKRAGDPLDVSALTNATSSWFRRTVGFAGHGLVPNQRPDESCGFQCPAPDEVMEYLTSDLRSLWRIAEVWNEAAAVELANRFLSTLKTQPA